MTKVARDFFCSMEANLKERKGREVELVAVKPCLLRRCKLRVI